MSRDMSIALQTEMSPRAVLEWILVISGLSAEITTDERGKGVDCYLEPNSLWARDDIHPENKMWVEYILETYGVEASVYLIIMMHWEDKEQQELRILDWVVWFLLVYSGDIVWCNNDVTLLVRRSGELIIARKALAGFWSDDKLRRLPEPCKVTDYIRPLA